MAKNAQNFEQRPWGTFEVIHEFQVTDPNGKQEDVVVKKLEIFPGKRLSYQSHTKRQETWHIVQGQGVVTLNDKDTPFVADDVIHVPIGTKHRFANNGLEGNVTAVEIGRGEFDELDNTRYEDDFGRS